MDDDGICFKDGGIKFGYGTFRRISFCRKPFRRREVLLKEYFTECDVIEWTFRRRTFRRKCLVINI